MLVFNQRSLKMVEDVINNIGNEIIVRTNKNLEKYNNKLIGLVFEVRYSKIVGNTHSCPINGVTNWALREEGKPTGYPGFHGRVWLRFMNNQGSFGSNVLYKTGLNTGTGGGGSYDGIWKQLITASYKLSKVTNETNETELRNKYNLFCYSYDCKIFLDDFSGMQHLFNKLITFDAIAGTNKTIQQLRFEWEDKIHTSKDEQLVTDIKK